ncbi:cell division protein FtsQ/DivIB [Thalassiella azotivora]
MAAAEAEQDRRQGERRGQDRRRSPKRLGRELAEDRRRGDRRQDRVAAAGTAVRDTARSVVSRTSVRRFAERAREERRRVLRRVGWVLAASVVLAAAAWVLLWSPWLAVDEVSVQGTERVAPAEVQQAASSAVGVPLARVDLGAVEDDVRGLVRVLDATVERDWPSGLRVRVVERRPVAVVPAGEGALDVVDGEGVVLESVNEPPAGLPLVQVDVATAGPRTVVEAVAVLTAMPPALRGRVTTLSAASRDSVTLELADGSQVVWGSAEDSELKAMVLEVLLQRPAEVYDVSAPDTPVTRDRG